MSEGPYGTPPDEPAPAGPPADTPAPQSEVPPAAEPPAEPGAAAAPGPAPEPGGYYPPPAYAAAPPPRGRSAGPLIAGVIIVVVLIAAIGGYVVGGYAYATTRLNNATSAYNKVVDHMNGYNDTINGLSNQLTGTDTSASASTLQSDKTVIAQIVTKSQAAQGQIDQDDASLQQADSGLHENAWLTLVRKNDIDKASTRLAHERNALAVAKEITADYVQIGTFYQTFFDVAIDVQDLGTKAQASDISGASAADEKLKTDVAKAISEDKAPGLPTTMDTFLKDLQALANDFSALVNAKDSAAQTAAESALESDGNKVQSFDYNQLSTAVHDYYQPLIDKFNSEVDKANNS
jgi:hypothetical protein